MQQFKDQSQKVYLVCLNPHCLKDKQRCLTTYNLHNHPKQCAQYYYPAEEIIQKHWTKLQKYPMDNLGVASKKKFTIQNEKRYLSMAIQNLKLRIEASLKQLEQKVLQIYPQKQFIRSYTNVYNLQKVSQSLKLRKNPSYISSLLNDNFSATNYHVLLRINESYDDLKNTIDGLNSKIMQHFDFVLKKHKNNAIITPNKKVTHKKINYGVFKSKFIASSKIQFNKAIISFPKITNIASFLPWIYTDKYFNEGIHQFKISSLKYPIVQNAGFTVLEQHDIDTYPYNTFKSLFNKEGKGFKLLKGEDIDQFISQTTVVILRIELGASQSKAIIHDSQMKCYYQSQLRAQTTYRMGIYGCGWTAEVIQLN